MRMVWKPEQITALPKRLQWFPTTFQNLKSSAWHSKPRWTNPSPTLCVCVLVAQSCMTLCDLMDCSPPGSSVRGILSARILERVAMPSSRGSSQPRDWTQVSCTAGRFFSVWATREATAHYLLGPCNSSLLVFFLPLQHAMLLPASKSRHVFPLPGNCFHSHPTLLSCPPFLDEASSFLRSPSLLGSCVHSLTSQVCWVPSVSQALC